MNSVATPELGYAGGVWRHMKNIVLGSANLVVPVTILVLVHALVNAYCTLQNCREVWNLNRYYHDGYSSQLSDLIIRLCEPSTRKSCYLRN